MSEPAAKHRPSIDLEEFERRLRGPAPAQANEDPLAELARLVGEGAPFTQQSAGFRKTKFQPRVVPPVDWSHDGAVPAPSVNLDSAPLRGTLPQEPIAADPAFADDEEFYPEDAMVTGEHRPPRSRRPLFLMAGALAFVLAGIAVTFATKGHRTGGEAPTIKAAVGPTKVQPTHANVDDASRDASPLDRSVPDDIASSRMVDHLEQPVDLQTIREQHAAAAPGDAANAAPGQGGDAIATAPLAAAPPPDYFPEPKRVHTVSVRPDGTVISDAPTPPARAYVANSDPTAVAGSPIGAASAAVTDTPPVARPATPKTTARVMTTPKAGTTPVATAGLGADLHPVPPALIPTKPATRVADASGAVAAGKVLQAPVAVGGYAVQLAAPVSEQEAEHTMARLEQKFSNELGGRHTTVEKADSNGHTVYRVRVVGLSSDDANILCSRLKAGGGACFVARN